MPNLTIRNIPDSILEKIKTLSLLERRSMNSEILVLLEQAVELRHSSPERPAKRTISVEMQTEMWKNLAGKWEDERSAEEIIKDIYTNRTNGRHVEL